MIGFNDRPDIPLVNRNFMNRNAPMNIIHYTDWLFRKKSKINSIFLKVDMYAN